MFLASPAAAHISGRFFEGVAWRYVLWSEPHEERVVESDVKSSAIVIAATLYQLAMRDEMVPRFAPGDMPARVVRTSSAQ